MTYELTNRPRGNIMESGNSFSALEACLSSLPKEEPFQLWIFRSDGEMACVLANASVAWVNVLGTNGEDFLSLAPDYDGQTDEVEKIYLENGQLDEMPSEHCVPIEQGIAAGLHYFEYGRPTSSLKWCPEAFPDKCSGEIFLSTITDAFEINGRGCVVVPGLPSPTAEIPVLRRGVPIVLRRPDGSKYKTTVRDIELISTRRRTIGVPILLPLPVSKADVPLGTEIWYQLTGSETFGHSPENNAS